MIETANGAPSRLESQWRTSMRLKFGSITSPNDASTPLFRRKVSASETSPPILPAFQMSNLKSEIAPLRSRSYPLPVDPRQRHSPEHAPALPAQSSNVACGCDITAVRNIGRSLRGLLDQQAMIPAKAARRGRETPHVKQMKLKRNTLSFTVFTNKSASLTQSEFYVKRSDSFAR